MAATRPAIHVTHMGYAPTSWHELCQIFWEELRDHSRGLQPQPGDVVRLNFRDCTFQFPADWLLTPVVPELNFTMLRLLYDDDLIVQSLLDILEHK